MKIDGKILYKILTSSIKASYTMIMWYLSQGCKDFSKSVNQCVIYHINKLKNINHMIISVDTEKAFYKIQHSVMIITLQKVGIEGAYLNIGEAIYD